MKFFTKKRLIYGLKHYLSNIFLIWLAILFYRYNSYYVSFLKPETQNALFYLALTYTISGFFYYIFIPLENMNSKGYILLKSLKRVLSDARKYVKNFTQNPKHPLPRMEKQEKTALLFVLVKIFYLPIMLNFFFGNYSSVKNYLTTFPKITELFGLLTFNNFTFSFLIALFFLIDTLIFSFGYAVELKILKNKVKSVEPTVLGWVVALICYPPFNGLFTKYVNWYASDNMLFGSNVSTYIVRIILVLLVFIYLSATIALGFKSSNLTNRGIVKNGPYRFVRHPAYISKNLFWWITIIPIMNIAAFFSMFTWSFIYYLRAITEERHLIKDPDYQEYCKKVKYRFIPYIW